MGYELPVFPWRRAPEQDGATLRHKVAVDHSCRAACFFS